MKEQVPFQLNFKIASQEITVGTQPTFTCSKLTMKTLEQGVKYVQS